MNKQIALPGTRLPGRALLPYSGNNTTIEWSYQNENTVCTPQMLSLLALR